MSVRRIYEWGIVAALSTLGTILALHKALGVPPPPVAAEAGAQVLTRGPVHEAFAETVTFDPLPGIVAPKAPPAAIEELPPGQKPAGADVAWIPGYWGWDDERSDFLWVSGIWRDLPPGRQWVPGYWGKSTQGFQWTSGYWADAKVARCNTCPSRRRPPKPVPRSPRLRRTTSGCPAAGCGSKTAMPGVPVSGARRSRIGIGFPRITSGLARLRLRRRLLGLFHRPPWCPVCAGLFPRGRATRPGFSYSPATVINLGVFANHLFLRPKYQHYYFGDYYAANYQAAGFYPSYSYNSGRFGYDPIFADVRWQRRQDLRWSSARGRLPEPPGSRRSPAAAIWAGPVVIGGGRIMNAGCKPRGTLLDEACGTRTAPGNSSRGPGRAAKTR